MTRSSVSRPTPTSMRPVPPPEASPRNGGRLMSQENVELVLSVCPASDLDLVALYSDDEQWSARAEVLAPVLHSEVECFHPGLAGDKTYTGLDGLRAFWTDWLAPWTTYRMVNQAAEDHGD